MSAEIFKSPLQRVVQYDKYSKWLVGQDRRETWEETCERVVGWFKVELYKQNKFLPTVIWHDLKAGMLTLSAMPSMRIVQMAGPSLTRCHVGGYNCAYLPLSGPQDLAELLYILMQGTGCGFSVEKRYIDQWPQISPTETVEGKFYHTIKDTTEGWCDAFKIQLHAALDGKKLGFNFSYIRPEGAWLHTKGGRASGPKPLKELLAATWNIIRNRSSEGRLRSFDIHRLACVAGQIVQVGGVRRSALISLSDLDDEIMRTCKGNSRWFQQFPELSQANNSAVYSPDMDSEQRAKFELEWEHLSEMGSGERGIFVRPDGIANRSPYLWGTNPCGEIILRPKQFCNLSQAIARSDDTEETLMAKVKLATIWGTIQSSLTNFHYLSPEWKQNCDEERLLGVDITGAQDCPLLNHNQFNHVTSKLLERLRFRVKEIQTEFATYLALNPSVAITCNKPSGNSSQLMNCSSGIHPRYSKYYIRRIRLGARTPLANHLVQCGFPCVKENSDRVWVFSFPIQSPPESITRHQLDDVDQLEYWKIWKHSWTDHNPSCTIYVEDWAKVKQWLLSNWSSVGGLSFLPLTNTFYPNAPYEDITQSEYDEMVRQLPTLDLTTLREITDNTTMAQDYACEGDVCQFGEKEQK